MTAHTVLALVFSAVCLGGALATEGAECNPLMEKCAAVSGEVLLQKKFKQSRLSSAGLSVEPEDDRQTQPSDMSLFEMAEHWATSPLRHGLQSGYQGSPHCVSSDVGSSQMQNQLLLLTTGVKVVSGRQAGGMDAPLNSEGFRDTTAMCCPVEMEMFFNRLLDSLGLDVCSKPHVQGLMHWFTCVPKMDFGYVLAVIANGNPCKYWAPKGKVCPAFVGSCAGQWCGQSAEAQCTSTRDNGGGNSCASQMTNGNSDQNCQNYLLWKDCDQACNLCACSTASGTTRGHCSGHGTCSATCSQSTCTGASCQCDSGWTGSKCEQQATLPVTVAPTEPLTLTCGDPVVVDTEASGNTGWRCTSGWCTSSCQCRGSSGTASWCCGDDNDKVCSNNQCVPRCATTLLLTEAP